MMCGLVGNVMDLYAEGRLAAAQVRWVASHCAGCGRCAAELAAWRMQCEGIRSLARLRAPKELKERLKAAVMRQKEAMGRATTRKHNMASALPVLDLNEFRLQAQVRALAFAGGFAAAMVAVSVCGPGLPSQSCSDLPDSVCLIAPVTAAPGK